MSKRASTAVETIDDSFQEDICGVCALVVDWRCALEIENRNKGRFIFRISAS